jgi:O-antigen/teichoic acid export membrane protein
MSSIGAMLHINKLKIYLSRNTLHRRLLDKSGGSFIIKIAGTTCAFLLQVVLARFLGVETFGEYIYVITWINFFVLLSILGFDSASLKFLPVYKEKRDSAYFKGFVTRSMQFVITASLAISLAGTAFIYINSSLPKGMAILFLPGFLLIPINALNRLLGSFLQALLNVKGALIPQHVIRPLLTICGLAIIFYILNIKITAQAALMINLAAGLLVTGILLYLLRPHFKHHNNNASKFETSEWRNTALALLLISVLNIVLTQADILMLGGLIGTTEAGIYAVAVKTATLIAFILTAVNSVAAPMISRLYSQGNLEELQRLITFSAKIVFFVSLPLYLAIISFSDRILTIFGTEFTAGGQALIILASAQLFNAVTGSVGFLLSMTGHHKYALQILTITASANIVLNIILIPVFGISGAAIATAVSTVFWNAAMFLMCRKLLGLNSTIIDFTFDGVGK